jgi:hypothetical protein
MSCTGRQRRPHIRIGARAADPHAILGEDRSEFMGRIIASSCGIPKKLNTALYLFIGQQAGVHRGNGAS